MQYYSVLFQYYFSTILLFKARIKPPETQGNNSTRVPSFSSLGISTISDELLQHEEYSCSLSWTFYVRGLCTPYKFKDMNVVKVLHVIETNFSAIWFFSVSVIWFKNLCYLTLSWMGAICALAVTEHPTETLTGTIMCFEHWNNACSKAF